MDGVLASFVHGYERVIKEVSGRDLFPAVPPPTWDWPQYYGYSGEEVSKAWDAIKSSTSFWRTLPPVNGAVEFLERLNHLPHEIYFITDRTGTQVQWQTSSWLSHYGFALPSVIVTPKHGVKGKIAHALKLDLFIDDKPMNIGAIQQSSKAVAVLMRKSYNATYTPKNVVHSLAEFEKEYLS
jgi:hypothetical protein